MTNPADDSEELAKLLTDYHTNEQDVTGAERVATVIAAFYCKLRNSGVEDDSAVHITLNWMDRVIADTTDYPADDD